MMREDSEKMVGMRNVLVDGYNAIHSIRMLACILEKRGLEEARKALAQVVHAWRVRSRVKGTVCIVYDGNEVSSVPSSVSIGGVPCVFTMHGCSADSYMVNELKAASMRDRYLVLSDDNYIRNHCKAFGVDVQSVSVLEESEKRRGRVRAGVRSRVSDEKEIAREVKDSINKDLKKAWGIDQEN